MLLNYVIISKLTELWILVFFGVILALSCPSYASPTTVGNVGSGATIDSDISATEAIQPRQIAYRIDKYRKGDLIVKVVGPDGRPVSGASVQVRQRRHAFLFGCNLYNLDTSDHSPAQLAYQNEFAALFNYATLPFYWKVFEPKQGQPDYARLQSMVDWCAAHNIEPKGHPLIWHELWPDWAPSDADSAIPLLHARVFDIVSHYKGTIHYWDVVNEANWAAHFTPANGETAWVSRDGPASVVGTALGWARAAGAGSPETFIYNDYNTDDANVALLTSLQSKGELPDAIGIQSHMHSGMWPLTKVWEVCDRFSQFGKPIHFTETTVLSGPTRTDGADTPATPNWNTTPDGEAAQADYVVQFYSVLFSYPAVSAITWWDFSDYNSWMGAPAGLVRQDMTPKPAYTRLLELIHKEWWTSQDGIADQNGTYSLRAFYGDYQITAIDSQGRKSTVTVNFPEWSAPRTVIIRFNATAVH
jgi:GH35 family endo-1,4-beta-xylanase